MSYWNRPFFPEWCGDAIMDDHVTYDTTVRIGGSFSGIAEAFKVIAGYYGWTHIVLVSDDDDTAICWYGGRPLNEILSNNENYTFTWLRFGSDPTDEQLDDILEQTRARTRGMLLHFTRHITAVSETIFRTIGLISTNNQTHHNQEKIYDKKLSYRRESAQLYRTVQNAFRYLKPFRRGSRV